MSVQAVETLGRASASPDQLIVGIHESAHLRQGGLDHGRVVDHERNQRGNKYC
jgi:hypothetical protein